VRIEGTKAWLTVKGPLQGLSRLEFEYKIPLGDGEAMLVNLCKNHPIEKLRFRIPFKGHIFEVDEFRGENQGLVIAEVELKEEEEPLELPDWIGDEVTSDERYYNSYLSENPFQLWNIK
jgi:CYTH domain-containing protein